MYGCPECGATLDGDGTAYYCSCGFMASDPGFRDHTDVMADLFGEY